ncbi:MAG: ABC transporter ATP-binding protein [Alphaproteobacteria bacterium]
MNDVGAALDLIGVLRRFDQGETAVDVLKGVNLAIRPGEIVALVGPSGAGKSTLLQIAGLLERPTGGEVRIGGTPCSALGDDRRTQMRRAKLGFVYQYHHLLPEFSAIENVMLPQMIAGVSQAAARERARTLLAAMGLAERESHVPGKLSGGEQQRVAIARALANGPAVLLADEPTGNLDLHTADAVFAELLRQVRGAQVCALVATHNPELARRMDRIVRLVDGILVEQS